jgi:amino-acid N-acetyltransferase
MIHADAYHHIRPAMAADLPALLAMMQYPVEESALLPRGKLDIETRLDDFHVIEVDGHLVGSVALHVDPDAVAELAALCVRRANKGRGFGRELVRHVEAEARRRDCRRLVALSTQAFRYFEDRLGWVPGEIDDLPESRREAARASGRNSRVVMREL